MARTVVAASFLIAGVATVRADTAFGWRFTPPSGYKLTRNADHVAYLKIAE